MSFTIWLVIVAFVLFLCLLGLLVLISRPRKLSAQAIERFSHKIFKTSDLDPAHALLESHKIFVAAISELAGGKNLTAAQKISKIQKRLPHAAKIWTHHRLRNRVAHETDVRVSKIQAENARKDFVRALKVLG